MLYLESLYTISIRFAVHVPDLHTSVNPRQPHKCESSRRPRLLFSLGFTHFFHFVLQPSNARRVIKFAPLVKCLRRLLGNLIHYFTYTHVCRTFQMMRSANLIALPHENKMIFSVDSRLNRLTRCAMSCLVFLG